MPKALKRTLIAFASVAIFLGAAELVLRARGYFYPPVEPIQVWNRFEDRDIRLGTSLHEEAPRMLWAPAPGAAIPWGKDERVNPDGYRGPVLDKQKKPGVLRIATLGDSSTFGHSVGWEETWSAQLQRALEKRGIPCEVLNGGVVGYTARQGLERYRALIREYRPDIVVAAFGAINDSLDALQSIPDAQKIAMQVRLGGFWTQARIWVRKELRIVHFLAKWDDDRHPERRRSRDRAFQQEKHEAELRASVGLVDWPGVRRVPLDDFANCLTELDHDVRADGGRLVLLSMPRRPVVENASPVVVEYSKKVVEVGARLSDDVVDGRAAFARAVGDGAKVPQLFADAYHPSPLGHKVLAQELCDRIAAAVPAPAR